jgi:AraC-like DNA-binding protein
MHNWQLKFWRLPQLDNLELLHAARVTHDYPRHMHEEYSIAVILQGTEITNCRGTNHSARPGDLLLINAEEVHSNKSSGSEYRLVKVRAKTLQRMARDLGEPALAAPYFPELVVNDPLLFRRLLDLHLKLEQNISALEQESAFLSTMGLLLTRTNKDCRARRAATKAGSEDVYVRLVRDYLRSHYAENVSLTQLTSLTDLSPFYLLRVFHQHAGFPPHEYQTQVRIAHARKLIRNGTPLSQAALETGFFDQSHLSRNFKRIVGVTPRQYSAWKPHCDN